MARQPRVQWNEGKRRWMAWVRFPDGSRRKVERVDKPDADDDDLKNLLAERAAAESPAPRRERLASFGDVLDAWVVAGAPRPPTSERSRHAKKKSEKTIITIGYLLDGHVRPKIGKLKVDRTGVARVEDAFQVMDDAGLANEHDRPRLELPEPGLPVRSASRDDQDEPGRHPNEQHRRRPAHSPSRPTLWDSSWSAIGKTTRLVRCQRRRAVGYGSIRSRTADPQVLGRGIMQGGELGIVRRCQSP